MFCNRNGVLINWCGKQIEAMYQVFQVLIYFLSNKYLLLIVYYTYNYFKSYLFDCYQLNCAILQINWVFKAFIQVHIVLWSKLVVTE